jgi:HD-GYP domain-containing protein (c-di-GMP phosphodiesterase class II)
LLSQANPTVFSAGLRVSGYATEVAHQLKQPNLWQIEVASMLAQIGCLSLPTDIINKKYAGIALDDNEQEMWNNYPEIGARLLDNIPRLESVTKMIRWQQKKFADFDQEVNNGEFEEILIGAQILKASIDFDILLHQGNHPPKALEQLQKHPDEYTPDIVQALHKIRFQEHARTLSLTVDDITVGMIAEEDVVAKNGAMILPQGQEISWSVLQALYNFNRQVGIVEPIKVSTGLNDASFDDEKDNET